MNLFVPKSKLHDSFYTVVVINDKTLSLRRGNYADGVAWGFNERFESIKYGDKSWSRLHIATSSSYSDEMQAYAAGYMEGCLTHSDIRQFYNEFVSILSAVPQQETFKNRALTHWQELFTHCQKSNTTSSFTQCNIIVQLLGELEGYNDCSGTEEKLHLTDLFLLNSHDEFATFFPDLFEPLPPSLGISKTRSDFFAAFLSSHALGRSACQTPRVIKHYQLGFTHPKGASKVSFTSYPGMLDSPDAFYVLSNSLAIFRVPLEIQQEPYSNSHPAGLPNLIRSLNAVRFASSAYDWVSLHKSVSGEFIIPAKWLVVNLKNVVKQDMPEGTAWLTEETQTLSYSEDVTEYLAADGDLLQRMLDTQPFFAEIARNTLPINHTNHIDIQEWWGHVDSFSNAKQISREAVSDFVSVQKATPSVDFVMLSAEKTDMSDFCGFYMSGVKTLSKPTMHEWEDGWLPYHA